MSESRVQDGPSCPGCGLANYSGLCPHCRGDQDAYERELVPPFESSLPADQVEERVRGALREHYLAEVICDHEQKIDNPRCACSLVDLGWHPSVGAAVGAWIDHVMEVARAA